MAYTVIFRVRPRADIRDRRRRRLGQNFLKPSIADDLVAQADLRPGELVVEIGAGRGAITQALARRGVRVCAVEFDPVWAEKLRERTRHDPLVRVIQDDFLTLSLPREPHRVWGSLPFGKTTAMLHHLFDDPNTSTVRADLIVQWDVARKRAAVPPSNLISTTWAPWWEFALGRRIPAQAFRPVPRVDSGILIAARREPPLLPTAMAASYARFLRQAWPFERKG